MFEQLAALAEELDRLEADLPRIYAAGDRRASRDAGRRQQELRPGGDAYAEWQRGSPDVDEARGGAGGVTQPPRAGTGKGQAAPNGAPLAAPQTPNKDVSP